MTDDASDDSKPPGIPPDAALFAVGGIVFIGERIDPGVSRRVVGSVPWTIDFLVAIVTPAPLPPDPPMFGVVMTLIAALMVVNLAIYAPFMIAGAAWTLSGRLADLVFPR